MSLAHFTEFLERNVYNSKLSKQLTIIYTEEYEDIAFSVSHHLQPSFNLSIKKLGSIFDKNLENAILEKDIFLLFYSMPWLQLKDYYTHVRPLLNKYTSRSYVLRDCLNEFNHIYALSFKEVSHLHRGILKLGHQARKVLIRNSLGTDLAFTFKEPTPWRYIDGTNIPNEVVPSEVSNYTPHVNGRVVFTGVMVSLVPIGKKYGYVKEPITFDIEHGFIKTVSCHDKALEADLLKIFNYCEGNGEIVELGIGTNPGIKLVGMSAPFEERKLGFHLGTGGYKPKSQHIDFIFDSSDIYFDDDCIFSNNQFRM